jgi:hypothetical protein
LCATLRLSILFNPHPCLPNNGNQASDTKKAKRAHTKVDVGVRKRNKN